LETGELKMMFNYEMKPDPGIFRESTSRSENQEAKTMTALIVKFKSQLSMEELLRISEERVDRYRALDGLLQKYYLEYQEENHYGAVYIWESVEDIKAFRESDLYRTIPEAYQLEGDPEITMGEVAMTLRPEEVPAK
jgi:heme-degrading monooxygenase HmoA